jgi:formate dehydrogenase major subunit
MMNQGIPVFRLPREIIAKEIAQIEALGVKIICNTEIGKTVTLSKLAKENDAVILAAGTLKPNLLDLPGKELSGIRHGLEFLLEVNETGKGDVGKTVVVIGGGFTAMDCARTAKRLGAQVKVCYRRTAAEMLVTPGELEELEHEDIPMEYMVAPKAYTGTNGRLKTIQFVRTAMGAPDQSGRRRPVEIPGSEFELAVDTVLLATGQFPDTSWLDEASGESNVFSAGDFKNGASSLIQAIGHAKECVREVDRFLTGEVRLNDYALIEDVTGTGRIREMDAVDLQPMPAVELARRDLTTEVETGFDKEISGDEAQRCYQCHYKFEIDSDKCIYCDWCVKAKPRPECILKIKELHYDDEGRITGWTLAQKADDVHLIWINQDDCIRCGACVSACPVDAISIQKVSLRTGSPAK